MDNFYLYIFILICFIFAVSYLNTCLHDTYNEKKYTTPETNENPPETIENPPETNENPSETNENPPETK